jgi:hypothetical protein
MVAEHYDAEQQEIGRPGPSEDGETAPAPKTLDVVKYYLKEIRKTSLLTFAQEQELGKRVAEGDQEARARMIEANLRLVVAIGKKYINRGLRSRHYRRREPGPHQGRRKIPVRTGVQVQHLCFVVDQTIHRAGHREPGEDHQAADTCG